MNWAGLIVGLGNPGRDYEATRHNMGFMLVDALCRRAEEERRPCNKANGDKFRCELYTIGLSDNSKPWLLAKPQTYMNESGRSVQPLAAWHKIGPGNILVVHDELDLPLGRMRAKTGGSNAGHNGLASITHMLGTPDFHRLRLGIGRPPFGEVTPWVLGRLSEEEKKTAGMMLGQAVGVVHCFAGEGLKAASLLANKSG